MATPTLRAEKAYEKYAWIILFALSAAFLIFAFTAILFGVGLSSFPVGIPGGPDATKSITGRTWDEIVTGSPGIVNLIRGISRVFGLALLGFSAFGMAISGVSYRKGERWAWYVSWYLPAFLIGLAIHESGGAFLAMPILFLIVALLGLFLPYRRFFPAKNPTSP